MLFAIGCAITIVFACLHIVGHYRYVLNDCRTPPPLPPQVTRISISVAVVLGGLIGWLKNIELPPAVARGTVVSLQVMGVGLAINWSVVVLSGFREMDFGTYFVPFLLVLALLLGVSEGLIHRRLRALSGDPPDRE
ncbi:hypothetical protein [Planctomicrobium piriforme]|nr:hypothetical protein [Planctomicrobium piriforme]